MTSMKCEPSRGLHIFTADWPIMGANPWCDCGRIRNDFYRRTLVQKLLGLPKKPESSAGV